MGELVRVNVHGDAVMLLSCSHWGMIEVCRVPQMIEPEGFKIDEPDLACRPGHIIWMRRG